MTNDAWIAKQTLDAAVGPSRDSIEIEVRKRAAKMVALSKDREPAESGLESLETKLFVETLIVADREAPFGVVVGLVVGLVATPDAAPLNLCRHQSS
jgi:hypothetical protein